ncbi:MAG: hypothetical protein ACYCW6_15780 [Candidatus Xenobia bacterium]
MKPISLRRVLRAGWQQQDDGSFTRTVRPVFGDHPITATATATDGISPVVDFQRAARLALRNATGEVRQTRFFADFRRLNIYVNVLETDTLLGFWLAH